MSITVLFSFLTFVGMCALAFGYYRSQRSDTSGADIVRLELEKLYTDKIQSLVSDLERVKSEKERVSGEFAQLTKQMSEVREKVISYEERIRHFMKENSDLKSTLEMKEKELSTKVNVLNETCKAFEDEKSRIRREDEERAKAEIENRDRVWAEHENAARAFMSDVCKNPAYDFEFYTNVKLPSTFDGTFKPDFMIDFLGQYIIFDPKRSKSNDIQTYITRSAKETVEKIRSCPNADEIFTTVYLVVPTSALSELKQTKYFHDGYTVHVIALDSFEPIISAYKRITFYELADRFDPKDREAIVNLLAAYDFHINKQNALHLLSAYSGLSISARKRSLHPEILRDVNSKIASTKVTNFKESDMKRFIQDPGSQLDAIKELIAPRDPLVSEEAIQDMNTLF